MIEIFYIFYYFLIKKNRTPKGDGNYLSISKLSFIYFSYKKE